MLPLALFTAGATPGAAQTLVAEQPAFNALVAADAKLEKSATGFQFLEGIAYNPVKGDWIFSDIRANRLYRYEAASGATPVFREPSGQANGNCYNAHGDLFTCEQGPHRVAITRADGTVEYLPDQYEGKPLNSPNDIVVKADGTIWFTDPIYGLYGRAREQTANHVFCYDPATRELRSVVSDFELPNGLCFSPDEARLYIADSGAAHHVRVFDVQPGNVLANGRVFCVIDQGGPDGMRCDAAGNLFSSAADGIQIFNPAGERLGRILVPEHPANLGFGGPAGTTLCIGAQTSLYRIETLTHGAPAR